MKVLHITHSYWPATYFGGPIFSTLGLCNALMRIPGVELRVLSTDAAGPSSQDRLKVEDFPARYPPGYEVYFVRRTVANFAPGQLRWIWSQMCWSHCVLLTGTYSFHVIPTLLFGRLLGKPVAWSPRGALLDSFQWRDHRRPYAKKFYEALCRYAAGPLTTFVVTSKDEETACQARVPGVPTAIVSNGVEVPTELPQREWKPRGRTADHVSRASRS